MSKATSENSKASKSNETGAERAITTTEEVTMNAAQKKAAKAAAAKVTRQLKAETKRLQQEALEAAAEAQAEDEEGEEAGYRMSSHLSKYRVRYQRSVAASGSKSLNNGDALAAYLEMKTGKEVCELADKFLEPLPKGQKHYEKYARLNEGQKRMNSGNKLRHAIKNGTLLITEKGLQKA